MRKSFDLLQAFVVCITVIALAASGQAQAAPVFLSDFLGVPSGSSATASNAPYTTVVSQAYGFGVDVPGNFASNPIELSDAIRA